MDVKVMSVWELYSTARNLARPQFIAVMWVTFFVNILTFAGPVYTVQMYDRIIPSQGYETLVILSVFVTILLIATGLLDTGREALLYRVANRLEIYLYETFLQCFGDDTEVKKQDRMQFIGDVNRLKRFISEGLFTAILDLAFIPFFFLAIFYVHWVLGIFSISLIVLYLVFLALSSRAQTTDINAQDSESLLRSMIRNDDYIQPSGMSDILARKVSDKKEDETLSALVKSDKELRFMNIVKSSHAIFQTLSIGLGAYFVLLEELSLGMMIVVSMLLRKGVGPIQQLVAQRRRLAELLHSCRRICRLLHVKTSRQEKTMIVDYSGSLTISNLFVSKPGEGKPFLKSLNLELSPGQLVCIQGKPESGKSLLLRAIVGQNRINSGSITFDKVPINNWSKEQFGKEIGYLPQKVSLFNGTIKQNICRFSTVIDDQRIVKVASKVGVHDFICNLKDGYETQIQKTTYLPNSVTQKIGLARALYFDPKLLILDEPTTYLDGASLKALPELFAQLNHEGVGVLFTSNRNIISVNPDAKYRLVEGRLKEFGQEMEQGERRENRRKQFNPNVREIF